MSFDGYTKIDVETLEQLCVPLGVLPGVLTSASVVLAAAVKFRRAETDELRAIAATELYGTVDRYERELNAHGMSIVGVITKAEP